MPIIVKDFTWKQSDEKLFITVPLHGIHSSKVDVFISEQFIKLHYGPFVFEMFLLHKIDETDAEILLNDFEAKIELPKAEKMIWDFLEKDYSKEEKIQIKKLAIEEVQKKTRELLDERHRKKDDLKKVAIKHSMEMDSNEMKKVNELRSTEQKKFIDNFENWRKFCEPKIEEDEKYKTNPYHKERNIEIYNKKIEEMRIKKAVELAMSKIPPRKPPIEIPALRDGGTITVTFTDRIFPTPIRESQSGIEQIWLKKFNDARKESGFISEDLRPEERNPQWCKEKGDEFLKRGNYKGALNAYTHGIKLSEKLPTLYSNRAVAHFSIGNYNKCIEDCSTALELLVPECVGNLNMRIKCIVRRSAALTRIGMLNKAINEMKCAIKLQPNNEKLKSDLYDMERAWEQDPDSD